MHNVTSNVLTYVTCDGKSSLFFNSVSPKLCSRHYLCRPGQAPVASQHCFLQEALYLKEFFHVAMIEIVVHYIHFFQVFWFWCCTMVSLFDGFRRWREHLGGLKQNFFCTITKLLQCLHISLIQPFIPSMLTNFTTDWVKYSVANPPEVKFTIFLYLH